MITHDFVDKYNFLFYHPDTTVAWKKVKVTKLTRTRKTIDGAYHKKRGNLSKAKFEITVML